MITFTECEARCNVGDLPDGKDPFAKSKTANFTEFWRYNSLFINSKRRQFAAAQVKETLARFTVNFRDRKCMFSYLYVANWLIVVPGTEMRTT